MQHRENPNNAFPNKPLYGTYTMNVKPHVSSSGKTLANQPIIPPTFSSVQHVLVTAADVGLRLDRFLSQHFPGVPGSFIQRLLRTGQVRVNSGRVRGGVRLLLGDEVRLPPVRLPDPKEKLFPPERLVRMIQDRIIWRDEHLLVLNKPEGMAVHGGTGDLWGAVDALRRMVQLEEGESGKSRPELCHRLDKATSGCLLFALTLEALRAMAAAFRRGTVHKEYLALVRGHPHPETGLIDLPLSKGVVRSGERMVVSTHLGSSARTRYQVMEKFSQASLVRVMPESGRTHQIRVHFQSIGHPLAGDNKYGDPYFDEQMKKMGLLRLFLHAERLSFLHPILEEQCQLQAPLDNTLMQVLDAQRKRTMQSFPRRGGV